MLYTMKEMVQFMEITEHTLRYYTKQGLLPCKRDKNNRRLFDEESINWLSGIKCLKGCGMSLAAIREYSSLCMQDDTDEALHRRYQIIKKQLEIAQQKAVAAVALVGYMEKKVQHYEDILNNKIEDDTNPLKWKISKKHMYCQS